MRPLPNWLWPTASRPESSPLIRIGRTLHWGSTVLAALLFVFALIASASAAFAQESDAFNQASPAAQQAIRDARAMREAAERDVAPEPGERDWNKLSPTPPSDRTSVNGLDLPNGVGQPVDPSALPSGFRLDPAPRPTASKAGSTLTDAEVNLNFPNNQYNQDCIISSDGSLTIAEASGRCPRPAQAARQTLQLERDWSAVIRCSLAPC